MRFSSHNRVGGLQTNGRAYAHRPILWTASHRERAAKVTETSREIGEQSRKIISAHRGGTPGRAYVGPVGPFKNLPKIFSQLHDRDSITVCDSRFSPCSNA